MIHSAKQLKDKVKNISNGNNDIARTLIRNFFMERFLERVSLSEYHDKFILKGGMLVASMLGIDLRATMDIDTTVNSLSLSKEEIKAIIVNICNVIVDDGISFHIMSMKEIMEDFDYPGVRIMLEGNLERMRQSIKIDISTDDKITPQAMKYNYRLMFEDRSISLLSYNIETLLAEKIQTILSRGLANTRLRDFYDVFEFVKFKENEINKLVLREAFKATCQKRNTLFSYEEINGTLLLLKEDVELAKMWDRFKEKNYFVGELEWQEVINLDVEKIKEYLL